MAKFVPFIIKTDGSQNISDENRAAWKKSVRYRLKKNPSGNKLVVRLIFRMMAFEKYALKTSNGELVALAAYEILENDVMVHIIYIESQPESNPTIVGHSKKYQGIAEC